MLEFMQRGLWNGHNRQVVRHDRESGFAFCEPLHIAAHLILYATCYSFLRRATLGHVRSVVIATVGTLFIGCVQESIQCLTYGRAWGKGEVFDISVDTSALLWAEAYWNSWVKRVGT